MESDGAVAAETVKDTATESELGLASGALMVSVA
jgi:hypothetical protein